MFKQICTFENVLAAYEKARLDNRYKKPVCAFSFDLEQNVLRLLWELTTDHYTPRPYTYFTLHEPKTRNIAAPDFRDRVVQHALVAVIQPLFEKQFILDSYACRKDKGTHFAVRRVKKFLMAARSRNGKQIPMYVLQCDISKFFQSISWDTLLAIIRKTVTCPKTFTLIRTIVTTHNPVPIQTTMLPQLSLFSAHTASGETGISVAERTGVPIGNLTSQLFANIYLNELDHFVKERMRVHWYARYMDDFLILHHDRKYLAELRDTIRGYLRTELKLSLHPKKLTIKNTSTGVPFVGYRIFYTHVLVRGNTLRRIERNYRSKKKQCRKGTLSEQKLAETEASIIGHLKHANTFGLTKKIFED